MSHVHNKINARQAYLIANYTCYVAFDIKPKDYQFKNMPKNLKGSGYKNTCYDISPSKMPTNWDIYLINHSIRESDIGRELLIKALVIVLIVYGPPLGLLIYLLT